MRCKLLAVDFYGHAHLLQFVCLIAIRDIALPCAETRTPKTARSTSTLSECHQIRGRYAALGRPPQTPQFAIKAGYRNQHFLPECRRVGVSEESVEANAGFLHGS